MVGKDFKLIYINCINQSIKKKRGEMKTKKAIIHIGQEGITRGSYWTYCGRNGYTRYSWEEAKNMKPLCKNCIRAMEAEKRRREI